MERGLLLPGSRPQRGQPGREGVLASILQMCDVFQLSWVCSETQWIVFVQLSHSWTLPIGSLVVPIRELLSEPELMLDQWFNLDGASPESQILLRAELKVREPQSTAAAVVEGTPQLLFKSQEVLFFIFFVS